MKPLRYVSIDLETTGLDPKTCEIVEFGAVIDYVGNNQAVEDLPKFHGYLTQEYYTGQPYALSMHPTIFKRIATREAGFNYVPSDELGRQFAEFLIQHDYAAGKDGRFHVICAGKNFGSFDYRFLIELPGFMEVINVAHRALDPVMLYFDPLTMERLPSMGQCLKLAGLPEEVRHTAVEDAQDVIRLLRFKYPLSK